MAHGDDNDIRSWFYSLGVHAAVIGIVSLSLWFTSPAVVVSIPGPIIEATLVGPAQAPKPKATKPRTKPVEAKPEPEKPKEEPVPEPPKEDRKDQEKITDKVTQLKAEEDAKVQEELRKKEQIELAEKQAEAEKKKKLEEEKQKQLRDKATQEKAEKDRKAAEAKRLADMIAEEAKTGQEGLDASLEAEYYAAIQNAVTNAWLRPDTTPPGVRCTLEITQIVGGDVIQAVVVPPCNADAATRTTLEQAPRRASPLPYSGYENVFKRKIRFEFTYDG
jgi:colicin import membrane protein